MKTVLRFVALLPVVAGLFLGGCASEAEEVSAAGSAVVQAEPITLENYGTHPTIEAIRGEVAKIDSAPLAKKMDPSCGGERTQWTDGKGNIRKVFLSFVEGKYQRIEETAYYGETGELLLVRFNDTELDTNDQWRLEEFLSEGQLVLLLGSKVSPDGVRRAPEADVGPFRAKDGDELTDLYGDPSQVFRYSCDGRASRGL